MSIQQAELQTIRDDVQSALKVVEDKHNIKFGTIGRMTYNETTIRCTLEAFANADGDYDADINVSRLRYEANCWKCGMSSTAFGEQFDHIGITYRIDGVRPKGKKNKVSAVRVSDNRLYVFPLSAIPSRFRAT